MFACTHFHNKKKEKKNLDKVLRSLYCIDYYKIIALESKTCSSNNVLMFWLCALTFVARAAELCANDHCTMAHLEIFYIRFMG